MHSLDHSQNTRLLGLSPLQLYVLVATLARTATGGAVVALVLILNGLNVSSESVGILAACLTFPHLLGPVYGRWLDTVTHPKYLLSGMTVTYTGAFAVAVWSLQLHSSWLLTFSLLVSGVCSSFIMGGLGTQLSSFVAKNTRAIRRAQGLDTITYAIGHTLGPLIIAGLSVGFSPALATLGLASFAALAGVLMLWLPNTLASANRAQRRAPQLRLLEVLHEFRHSGGLLRTLVITAGAAFSLAALPVLAVYLAQSWDFGESFGAYLVAAYGIGNLLGAVYLIAKPLLGRPLTLLARVSCVLVFTLVGVTLSPSFTLGLVSYTLCGIANAMFFASSLAARTEYAPKHGAAQTYMWVAAAKIGAGSLGALMAGLLLRFDLQAPLWFSSAALLTIVMLCFGWRASSPVKPGD